MFKSIFSGTIFNVRLFPWYQNTCIHKDISLNNFKNITFGTCHFGVNQLEDNYDNGKESLLHKKYRFWMTKINETLIILRQLLMTL